MELNVVIADRDPAGKTMTLQILIQSPARGAKVSAILRRRQQFDIGELGNRLTYAGSRAVSRVVVDNEDVATREVRKPGRTAHESLGALGLPKVDRDDQRFSSVIHETKSPKR